MKKFFLIAMIAISTTALHAQLAHTTWKGVIKGDAAQEAVFKFGKDTLVLYAANGSVIETMKYAFKQNVLSVTKIEGQSDCAAGQPGKYAVVFAGGGMTLKPTQDDCYDRSSALDGTKWVKQKVK
ncbi:MAG TPA: hypothetical protein VG738_23410 [Chitinophagaceae bacterium]|nr:hypothetical protein [Chitinophagaceae bacterium]